MKSSLKQALVILLAVLLVTGCKKDKDKGDPPVLPPAGSMLIDFSNFMPGKKSDSFDASKGTPTSNWDYASGVALIWRAVINTTLAVPVKAFQAAVGKDPVYADDNTWQWKYDAAISVDNVSMTYKVRLTGQVRENDVLWKMYLAKEGTNPFSEFIWFEGTSEKDGTGGQWTLKQGPADQVPLLRIDWTGTGTNISTVKYTYIRNGDPFKESYIEFGREMITGPYNAYYDISYYNGAQFADVDVKWNTSDKTGRVMAPLYFPSSDWYCWDGNYNNVDCEF